MWKRFLLLFFVFGLSASCFGASANWNASIVDAEHGAPDGYRVYYGLSADQLTTTYDVGNQLNFPIPETWNPATYYFGVRAYNQSGESGWATTPEGQTWVAYTKADPPPILPPAAATDVMVVWELQEMPISRLGYQRFTSASDPAELSITVPSNTDAVVFVAGYYDSDGLTSVDIDGTQNFTVAFSQVPVNTHDCSAIAYYLGTVSAGAHTLNVNWGSSRDYVGGLYVIYYSGVDPVGIRDNDNTQLGDDTLTFTTISGDVVIVGGGADSDPSWTNATEIDYTYGSAMGGFIAELTADGTSESITIAYAANEGWGGIVLRMATGGGSSAVPKIMLLQDHFSGGIH